MADKKADLAGPGIGNYDDLKQELPENYEPLLSPKEKKYRSSMVTFKFSRKNYREAAQELMKKRFRVRVVSEANLDGIRVSFHVYNNSNEVNAVLNEISKIAKI